MDTEKTPDTNEPNVIYSQYESDSAIAEILDVFADSLPEMLTDMRSALRGAGGVTLASLAHQLKGSGGGYGYPMLTTVAGQLEQAARDGDWEIAAMCVAKLESLCAAVLRGRGAKAGESS